MLRWVSQNTRGVTPKEKDPKLTAGIGNIVKLQVGIAALQEMNAEWNQCGFREQYAKSYLYHMTTSRHSFGSSSEMVEGTYFKMGGTAIAVFGRWKRRMHKSGQYATGAGRWSWFTLLGKNNANIIYISCYGVCPRPAIHLIGSAYFQQYRIMEQEDESQLVHLDPHMQTIHDLQVCIYDPTHRTMLHCESING
jgi:hypothetical protein